MDSKTLQPEMGSKFVNAETNRDLQHASELEEAGQTSTFSEEKARADDAESGSVVVPAEQKDENDDGPKGIRFALLFTCILLGSFFIGYVRTNPSHEKFSS